MKKIITLFASILLCQFTHAATKIAQSNTGTGWGNAANWLPNGVPQNGDVVIIPSGLSITVKGSLYGTAANLTVYIHGNLDFDPSGKLNLGSSSFVQLTSLTSSITSNGTSSEQIIIGGGIKYNGSNDGTITGPAFTNFAAPNSTSSKAKKGFITGSVLPIQLTSFTVQEMEGQLRLNWVTVAEEGLKAFELERSANGRDWKTLTTVQPKNTCGCATSYQYVDLFPERGANYYRLRSLDWDGSMAYSSIVMTKYAALPAKAVVVNRNEASSTLSIALNSSGVHLPAQMRIVGANGQVVFQKRIVSNFTSLDVRTLPKGISLLVLIDQKGAQYVTKIVR